MKFLYAKLFFLLLCFCLTAEETHWKFDAGPDKQPPESGWVRLGRRTKYNEKSGYGWVKEWGNSWGYAKGSGVGRDGICADRKGIDGIFQCRLPNGVYRVTVTLGTQQPSEGRTGQCVEINGRILLPPPGVGGWGIQTKRTLPAVVTDGKLKIRFFTTASRNSDRSCVGAIEIEKAPEAQKQQLKQQFEAAPETGGAAAQPKKVKFGKHTLQVFNYTINKPLPGGGGNAPFFFIRDFSGGMLDDTVPRPGEFPARISGFSACGEINGFFAALHAPRKVTVKKIALSELKSDKGIIKADNAELFTLSCLYRSEYDRNRFTGRKTAELLEYSLPKELAAGSSLPCYFTVQVPSGTPAGVYRGVFSAETSAGIVKLPVELTVSAIKLKAHDKDFILSADADRWRGMSDKEISDELADMAKHGINGLTLRMAPGGGVLHEDAHGNVVKADFDRLEPILKRAIALGIDRKILLSGTNMILWGLKSLTVSTKGSWKQNNGVLTLSHGNKKQTSELRSTYWCAAFPQKRYNVQITYRMPAGSARGEVRLFDSSRKSVGKFTFALPAAADTTTKSFGFDTAFPTAQFMFYLSFTGNKDLEIKTLSMKSADDPAGELLSHSNFRRLSFRFDGNAPWPEPVAEQYRRIIAANAAAVKRLGLTPLIFGTDEAGNDPKSAGRELQELAQARKAGGVTFCNCSPAMAEKALSHLDVVCSYSSFIPDTDSKRTLLNRYHKMGKKLFAVSAGTYARQNFSIMPNRYNSGFYVARSGVDGLWIWTYQRIRKDPFDDFDAVTKDYALVYPPRQPGKKAVRSVAWEGIREGIRDYRWFRNLEYAISKAEKEKRFAHAARGKTVLNCILQAIPSHDSFAPETFNDKIADRLRRLCAIGIQSANGQTPWSGKAGLTKAPLAVRTPIPGKVTVPSVHLIPSSKNKPLEINKLYHYVTGMAWNNEKYRTRFQLSADSCNLYVRGQFKYPANAKSAPGKGEMAGFSGDHIEFLIEPLRNSGVWYHFAVNRHGQKSEMYCSGSRSAKENIFAVNYEGQKRESSWSCPWEAKVTGKNGVWHLEAVIPLNSINASPGDLWGVLLARCGIGTNIANKAIGFFDQPEKFPEMTAAGEAGLRTVPVLSSSIGRNVLDLRFEKLRSGKLILRESGKGKSSSFTAAIRKDGSAALHYRLRQDTARVELEALNDSGKSVWKSRRNVQILSPLVLTAPERVFFDSSNQLKATVKCRIAPELAKKAQLELSVLDSSGKTLFTRTYPAESAAFSLDTAPFKDGFYKLSFKLKEKNTLLAGKSMDFAVLRIK